MVVLIPPRGEISDPQYYAHGPDIPRALEAVEAARRTSGVLDQELDAQLVGLARLVVDPGRRRSLANQPVITVAGDLHNNTVGVDLLDRLADDGPVFFVGDLTDRGSPFETRLVRRAARSGNPFVFVSGNHDSDFSARELAREGAIVLTRNGRLDKRGEPSGPVINRINGLRVAGYDDPYERRMDESYADRYDADARPGRAGQVPRLAAAADRQGRRRDGARAGADRDRAAGPARRAAGAPAGVPRRPHAPAPTCSEQPGVTVINGGSMGAGGTGNLTESTNIGVARFVYTRRAVVPAAGRRPRLDRPRDGLLVGPADSASGRVPPSCGTSCWSLIAAACGTRTGRCPPSRRRCRWSPRRACG